MKAGASIEKMNTELRAAALFYRWVDPANELADEYSRSRAGYLEPISTRQLRGAAELLAIKAAIYKGIGCDLDMAVAVYDKNSLKRLAFATCGRSGFRAFVPSFRARRSPARRYGRMAGGKRLDGFELLLDLERQVCSYRRSGRGRSQEPGDEGTLRARSRPRRRRCGLGAARSGLFLV